MKNSHKLLSLLLIAIASFLIGTYAFDIEQSTEFTRNYGYWYILLLFLAFIFYGFKAAKNTLQAHRPTFSLNQLLNPKFLLCTAALLALFLFSRAHESTGFKIVMDEPNLAGVGMSMHYNREVFVPARAHTILGNYSILGGYVDKRPLLFPFLISVVHDIAGYSVNNIFVLNSILSALFLLLTFYLCYQYRGIVSGLMGALLVVSIPIWVQNANGGGFELLNMLMITSSIALSIAYLKHLNKLYLNLLILNAILLTQVRYESLLFLLPIALVIILGWIKRKNILTSWLVYTAPALLIPYLLQHKIFDSSNDFWQLNDKPHATSPFSLDYFFDNLGHTLNFFFSTSSNMPNSLLVSILGLIAITFFLFHIYKTLKNRNQLSIIDQIYAIFLLGFAANTLLLLVYFYGQLDNPIIQRLSLPLHIPLILGIIWLFYKYTKNITIRRAFVIITAAFTLTISIPTITANSYTKTYVPAQEAQWLMDYAKNVAQSNQRVLVLSERTIVWILNQVDAVSIGSVLESPQKIAAYQSYQAAPTVWTHQVQTFDLNSQQYNSQIKLPKDWSLKPVLTKDISLVRRTLINEIVPKSP